MISIFVKKKNGVNNGIIIFIDWNSVRLNFIWKKKRKKGCVHPKNMKLPYNLMHRILFELIIHWSFFPIRCSQNELEKRGKKKKEWEVNKRMKEVNTKKKNTKLPWKNLLFHFNYLSKHRGQKRNLSFIRFFLKIQWTRMKETFDGAEEKKNRPLNGR